MCALPPKTRKQIATEYAISTSSLRRKLKQYAVELPAGDLLPRAQKSVYEALGYPAGISASLYEKINIQEAPDGDDDYKI